jgi:hypothetical protein
MLVNFPLKNIFTMFFLIKLSKKSFATELAKSIVKSFFFN